MFFLIYTSFALPASFYLKPSATFLYEDDRYKRLAPCCRARPGQRGGEPREIRPMFEALIDILNVGRKLMETEEFLDGGHQIHHFSCHFLTNVF